MSQSFIFNFCQNLKESIHQMDMLPPGSRVLIAVSGGPDSTVLLNSLFRLMDNLEIELNLCHVQHGLRGEESIEDERFVISMAKEYELPLTVRRLEPEEIQKIKSGNLEEHARNLRYQKLVHTALELNCSHIATGHTKSDQAETILHRIMRSTGFSGLCGILPIREDMDISIIRPLIHCSRHEIMEYIKKAKLKYRLDSMNEDLSYTRNRIRKELLPLIQDRYNPNIEEALVRLAHTAQMEEQYWQSRIRGLIKQIGQGTFERPADRQAFIHLYEAEQRRLLRFYCQYNWLDPTWQQIQDALALINCEKKHMEFHFCDNNRLFIRDYEFFISQPYEKVKIEKEYNIKVPGSTYIPELDLELLAEVTPHDVVRLNPFTMLLAEFDVDKVKEPIRLRKRNDGDRMHPLGMKGTKKVKKIMQENGIPVEQRDSIPIICFGDEIAWVVGCCTSESFRLDDSTRRILRLTVRD